jgi:hypothetical protein
MVFAIYFPDTSGPQKQKTPFFARRTPLPVKPEFFING